MSFNFMAAITICSDFGAQENKENIYRWSVSPSISHEVMGPVELFQILEDDAVKVLHSICQQMWKAHRTRKGQFPFQSQRKAMPKNAQTTAQLHSSHTLVK